MNTPPPAPPHDLSMTRLALRLRPLESRTLRSSVTLLLGACLLAGAQSAHAQLPLDSIVRHHPKFAERILSPRFNAGKPARLVVSRASARASTPGVSLSERYLVVSSKDQASYPGALWTPPKRLLIDQVREWVGLERYRGHLAEAYPELANAGLGQGVTIGIVDGGIDLRHPDLRNPDGTTRAAWLLDFASEPLGFHADLEEEYGCTAPETPCAILSSAEIDLALSGATGAVSLPQDRLGHGTHVTSIAAGSGQSDVAYRGIAPEATLIVALLAVDSVEVADADVLLASKFVYERAAEAGQPAVVNLSLGGDFGPHDGSTILERALVDLLDRPGRAMVVASGNSGGTYAEGPESLQGPFGIHTDVTVTGEQWVSIAIPSESDAYDGDILVWVDAKPDQVLAVGVDSDGGTVVSPVAQGDSSEGSTATWDALVSNHVPLGDEALADLESGGLVLLSGEFQNREVIRLHLVGQGNASLWVQSSGDLSANVGSRGALFALARQGGTVTVPATAPELISVGATLNRATWPSRSAGNAQLSLFSENLDDTLGSVGFFSSLGPNQAGVPKPDVLAPGAVVIGAMAPSADPMPPEGAPNELSMFGFSPVCESDNWCAVVNDNYGVAIGTSMASPVVSGAVALLLEQAPNLTQSELLGLLRAGVSRQVPSKTTAAWEKALPPSPGALDLPRMLAALDIHQQTSPSTPPPSNTHSWLTFADVYVSPGQTLVGSVWTRTEEDAPAEVTSSQLEVAVTNGKLDEKPTRVSPGLFRFVVRASEDAPLDGSLNLEAKVRIDGATLVKQAVPIAGDLSDVRGQQRPGPALNEESCVMVRSSPTRNDPPWYLLGVLLVAGWRRSKRLRGRAPRRPKRQNTSPDQ